MGFSLKRAFKKVKKLAKKGLKLADKLTLGAAGLVTGGLTDGTIANDVLKAAGILPGEIPNIGDIKNKAELEEAIKLAKLEKTKRAESTFLATEGQGKRREAQLSFGDSNVSKPIASQRATGRFDTNRLVL